ARLGGFDRIGANVEPEVCLVLVGAVAGEAVFRKDGADVFVELQLGLIGGNAMARDHRRKQNNDDARSRMHSAYSKAHRFRSLHHTCLPQDWVAASSFTTVPTKVISDLLSVLPASVKYRRQAFLFC